MTILDFEPAKDEDLDYDTVQKVWGGDVNISVLFENKETGKSPDAEEVSRRSFVRRLAEKLKFLENNRAVVEDAVITADIKGFTADDLKTLYISWMLYTIFTDTGESELYVYLVSAADVLGDAEIAITVHDDNTVTVDDIV